MTGPMRHRRRSWWDDVKDSSVMRGLAVAFVVVSFIGIGMAIARVTA